MGLDATNQRIARDDQLAAVLGRTQ